MANVFALNVFYDTPVKIYSSHLFLFAAGLCLPDVGRIFSLFVLQRATQPRDLARPRLHVGGHVARLTGGCQQIPPMGWAMLSLLAVWRRRTRR